jgi:hypothetical protein
MDQKCPECGLKNDDNNWTCDWCGSVLKTERRIINYPDTVVFTPPFTIEKFFKSNYQLFTIIGVVGAMITLLPNLAEKIIGTHWLNSDFGFLPIVFAILTFACGVLIFSIFFILLKEIEIVSINEDEKWNLQRILLKIMLFLLMIGTFYFILNVIIMIPNYSVYLLSLFIFLIFIVGFTIYNYYLFFTQEYRTVKSFLKQDGGILKIIVYGILMCIIIILAACFIVIPITDTILNPQAPHDVVLLADQEVYSPLISTTTGLELYPTNSTNLKSFYPIYKSSGFRWETNYGFFVTEDSYSSKIELLDNYTVRRSNGKVFWSFSKEDIPLNKSPIQIKLKIYHAEGSNWTYLSNTTLNLTWTDQGFARFEDYSNHSIDYWKMTHPLMISN